MGSLPTDDDHRSYLYCDVAQGYPNAKGMKMGSVRQVTYKVFHMYIVSKLYSSCHCLKELTPSTKYDDPNEVIVIYSYISKHKI